jgi:hypothetical protein
MARAGAVGEVALMYGTGSKAKRRNATARSAVREAVERVGGIIDACALLRVSNVTLFRWMKIGSIPNLDLALKLSKASGVPVEEFSRDYGQGARKVDTVQSGEP